MKLIVSSKSTGEKLLVRAADQKSTFKRCSDPYRKKQLSLEKVLLKLL